MPSNPEKKMPVKEQSVKEMIEEKIARRKEEVLQRERELSPEEKKINAQPRMQKIDEFIVSVASWFVKRDSNYKEIMNQLYDLSTKLGGPYFKVKEGRKKFSEISKNLEAYSKAVAMAQRLGSKLENSKVSQLTLEEQGPDRYLQENEPYMAKIMQMFVTQGHIGSMRERNEIRLKYFSAISKIDGFEDSINASLLDLREIQRTQICKELGIAQNSKNTEKSEKPLPLEIETSSRSSISHSPSPRSGSTLTTDSEASSDEDNQQNVNKINKSGRGS